MGKASLHTVFLALGSNLGERLDNLKTAIQWMPPQVRVTAESPVYETPPWGYLDQPAFLNQVVQGNTRLKPEALLAYLKQLEIKMGRMPTIRYGPRLIDIDILFYDELILNKPNLAIPHPHLHERVFVLAPLADIAPEYRHPISGKTTQELLAQVDSSQIRLFAHA